MYQQGQWRNKKGAVGVKQQFFFLLKSVGSFFEVGNMGPQNPGSAPGKTISSFATEEILVKYKFYSFYLEIWVMGMEMAFLR